MRKVNRTIKTAGNTACLFALLALGACSSYGWNGELEDKAYIPVSTQERYPIEVVKGTVKLNVPTSSARLTASQIDAVTRFAQQARETGAVKVYILRPNRSMNGDVIAGKVTQIFAQQGINTGQLRHQTFSGRNGAPVSLSFVRKFARTKECGNYPADFSRTGKNLPHKDFGCAYQHNVAAQIANPQDLLTPRTMTPSDPTRRHRVFEDYRTPKSPTTPEDSNSTVTTTDAGKS